MPDWRPPNPGPELLHIWHWYCELDAGRSYRDDGRPMPIEYSDIWHWSMLTGRTGFIGPFEVRVLRQLEATFFGVQNTPEVVPDYLMASMSISERLKIMFRMMATKQQDKQWLS